MSAKTAEFGELIGVDNRPPANGLAIDQWPTWRPENTLKALDSATDTPTTVLVCAVEPTIIDIYGTSVRAAVQKIQDGIDPEYGPPREASVIHLRRKTAMPLIGITVSINDKTGLEVDEPNQYRTGANIKLFPATSPRLARMGSYTAAMGIAGTHGASVSTFDGWEQDDAQRLRNASETVKFFGRMFNLGMTDWAESMGLPLIHRHFPVAAEDRFGSFELSGVSAEAKPHAAFRDRSYAKFSSPSTHPEAWTNMLNLTSLLMRGEPAYTVEDAQIIATYLHERRLKQYLRNREAAKSRAA